MKIFISKYAKSMRISGSNLAKELEIPIYSPTLVPSRRVLSKIDTIINWGLGKYPSWFDRFERDVLVYNPSQSVKRCSNKLDTLNILSNDEDVVTIPYTTSKAEAIRWITDGKKAVCRTILTGSSGRGIVLAKTAEEVVDAPLYTLYIPKKWEYRVHVINGMAVHIQQKRRLTTTQLEERGINNRNKYIRNLENGYIFSTTLDHNWDSDVSMSLRDQAVVCVDALDLDFGAVDLIVTKDGEVFILEVNSAPGLEGSTLDIYKNHFENLV